MNKLKFFDKLNQNVIEEAELIRSLPLGKYLLIYIPVYFLIVALFHFIGNTFFDVPFDIRQVFIQAIGFAFFFRIFHKVRKLINENFKNKHN